MKDLIAAISDVREKLGHGLYTNEAQVSKMVVMRLLQKLGWDVFDPAQVNPEFKIPMGKKEFRKVDYALLHGPFGPVVLIEAKDVGKATEKGEEQLFDYCSKQGVPLAVLTDGRTWNFYLPAGMGSYEQRRFATVNLVEDDEPECARILTRYLGFDAVVAGQSHKDAQSDYDIYRQQIVARQQFMTVWEYLVGEADSRVVRLFADEVERRCQIRPDDREVSSFLRTRFTRAAVPKPQTGPTTWSQPIGRDRTAKPAPPPSVGSNAPSFTLFGQTTSCRNDKEVLVGSLVALGERDSGLYGRLAPHFAGRTRSFLSREQSRIYPADSAQGILRSVAKLPGGWWLGTHSSTRTKNEQLTKAREVAGLADTHFTWQMKGRT